MNKKKLVVHLAAIKKASTQRRFLLDSGNDDVRRVKSLIRTQVERKTNEEENDWVKDEIKARMKSYDNPLIPQHDRFTNLIEFPVTLADIDFWSSMWLMLDRIAEAKVNQKPYDEDLIANIEALPIWEHAKTIKGLGPINLGNILAATGDLWRYANAGKLWKRMGLALIDDHGIQRKSRDKPLAAKMAYSPPRRALMYVVAEGLMKGGRKKEGQPTPRYKIMYDRRKEYEMAKEEVTVKGHGHNRALRYLSKRILKELLLKWREVCP